MDNKKKKLWIIFGIYIIVNVILMILHEPWRDEIHAWLMAKNYDMATLISESRFDGHPILWHLILMPFAKMKAPIITLNIISTLIMGISTWLFLFKTKIPLKLKVLCTFSIPFTYTYSAISRNYCLIMLIMMIIGVMYDKRYDKPILYSIFISLLIHTHALAWGLVAGLTITFHFEEIINYFKKKNKVNIWKIIIGLLIIVINTVLVVLELYGNNNSNYAVNKNILVIYAITMMIIILMIFLLITIYKKTNLKEYIILFFSLSFQIIIYIFVYSSIIFQRYILIFAIILFYIILVSKSNIYSSLLNKFYKLYFLIIMLGIFVFGFNVFQDIFKPYSSSKEMAQFINKNISQNETIYIDSGVIGQSMIPYLNTAKLYDIVYESYVEEANYEYNYYKIRNKLLNIDKSYSGKYLIISNDILSPNYEVIYNTKKGIINEKFTLYYIP